MIVWTAVLAGAIVVIERLLRSRRHQLVDPSEQRLILLLLLVELRSGASVLGALQATSRTVPTEANLGVVVRVGTAVGLTRAVAYADETLRPIVSQLARAQRSGASLTSTVRQLLEQDLARERSTRLAKAKSLPIKLMVPTTLLMLPGLVVMLYGPTLLDSAESLLGSLQ